MVNEDKRRSREELQKEYIKDVLEGQITLKLVGDGFIKEGNSNVSIILLDEHDGYGYFIFCYGYDEKYYKGEFGFMYLLHRMRASYKGIGGYSVQYIDLLNEVTNVEWNHEKQRFTYEDIPNVHK